MRFELDHLFICTVPGAAAAEELIHFGLREGPQIGTSDKVQQIDGSHLRTP